MTRKDRTETPSLDIVLEEIANLKRGIELLNAVYLDFSFERTIKEEILVQALRFHGL